MTKYIKAEPQQTNNIGGKSRRILIFKILSPSGKKFLSLAMC